MPLRSPFSMLDQMLMTENLAPAATVIDILFSGNSLVFGKMPISVSRDPKQVVISRNIKAINIDAFCEDLMFEQSKFIQAKSVFPGPLKGSHFILCRPAVTWAEFPFTYSLSQNHSTSTKTALALQGYILSQFLHIQQHNSHK